MNCLKIEKERLHPVVVELNTLLADYHIYYQNLRNFHWNVSGRHFFELHKKFENLYDDAKVKIDEIAERILTLKHYPTSSLINYLKLSSISEASEIKSDTEMVQFVLDNHSKLIDQMYEVSKTAQKIGDEGTIDLIGGYIKTIEKESWMLNAYLTTSSVEKNVLVSS